MHKKKILIADDERDVLVILEKELAATGYSVIAADSGNDAMALATTKHPDLIMLDLKMPDNVPTYNLQKMATVRKMVSPF